MVAACDSDEPAAVVEGRSGGPLPDEGCDWELVPLVQQRGVSLRSFGLGWESARNVHPDGADDMVWVNEATLCADGPTVALGGARDDVTRVVLTSPAGEEVVLEMFDVAGKSWRAVMGELPRSWRTYGAFSVEVVALGDGSVLAREPRTRARQPLAPSAASDRTTPPATVEREFPFAIDELRGRVDAVKLISRLLSRSCRRRGACPCR